MIQVRESSGIHALNNIYSRKSIDILDCRQSEPDRKLMDSLHAQLPSASIIIREALMRSSAMVRSSRTFGELQTCS